MYFLDKRAKVICEELKKLKVKQKFTYADKLGIPYAVIIGEDEAAAGTVSVKDLQTG